MTTVTLNVSMPKAMRDFVQAQTIAGNYGSASEYIRHLIRKEMERKPAEQAKNVRAKKASK